jgi:hypothetical protein
MLWRIAVLALFVALTSSGAEPNHSWDLLSSSVKVGKKVVVKKMDRKQIEGKLFEITPDAVTMRYRGKPEKIAREDVFFLRYADIRLHRMLIGMGAGAGGGALIGAASTTPREFGALGGCILGFLSGMAAAAVVPIGPPLYQADQRTKPAPAGASKPRK